MVKFQFSFLLICCGILYDGGKFGINNVSAQEATVKTLQVPAVPIPPAPANTNVITPPVISAPATNVTAPQTPLAPQGVAVQPPVTEAPAATSTITTTTVHPIINTLDSDLCKHCKCNKMTKILDCSNLNLTEWFQQTEIDTLLYGDVQFTEIQLNHNQLIQIPKFPKLINLKNLQLHHNKIQKINDSAFAELDQLEVLNLSDNLLTSKELLPKCFQGKYSPTAYQPLANLKYLNLANNDLHTLDPDLFEHFPSLEILNLSYNSFKVIDSLTTTAISSVLTLQELDMSYMDLKILPLYLFHSNRDLIKLDFNGNLFQQIPEALGYAISLKYLSLDNNSFIKLNQDNAFPELKKLEDLNLSYCPLLAEIGASAFSQLQNLKHLHITNNPKLSTIHPNSICRQRKNQAFFDYPPLQELLLHNNNLSTLPGVLIERWDKVEVIDLRNNPWHCDCDNDFMINVLFQQIIENSPKLINDVNCSTPKAWQNVPMKKIHDKKTNIRCTDLYNNEPENDGQVLIGILIGVLTGIPISLFLLYAYKRGCFGLLRRQTDPGAYNRAFYSKTSQDDYSI